jgi:hypothetical protein
LKGLSVGNLGRKRLLTPTHVANIYNDVTNSAVSLDGMSMTGVKLKMQKTMAQNIGLNEHANLDTFAPISNKTVKRYVNQMGVTERESKIKPQSRVEPYLNIRNAISKAAGLLALARVCPLENMHSEDEVGIFLFGWHQNSKRPKLVSTKQADEFLRLNSISLSTSQDPDQQRAAHIGATLQAHTGQLSAFYLRIVDSTFPEEFKNNQSPTTEEACHKPRIWLLNPDLNFYVVTCHPSVTDTTVSEYIGKKITHPAIFKKQDTVIEREISGKKCFLQMDTQSELDSSCLTVDEDNDGEIEGTLLLLRICGV